MRRNQTRRFPEPALRNDLCVALWWTGREQQLKGTGKGTPTHSGLLVFFQSEQDTPPKVQGSVETVRIGAGVPASIGPDPEGQACSSGSRWMC